MGVAVGRVEPHRFPQPRQRRLAVVRQRVRVPEVEQKIRVLGRGADRSGEELHGRIARRRLLAAQLHDPQRVRDGRNGIVRVQLVQLAERLIEPSQVDERQHGAEPRLRRIGRVGGHVLRRRERLVVQALRRVHVPERHENTGIVRRQPVRRLEEPLLRRGRDGHEAFHVVLERLERRVAGFRGRRPERAAGRAAHGERHALEQRKDVGQRRLVGHVGQAMRVADLDHAHVHREPVVELDLAEDHLRGIDQLADADRGRSREVGRRRQLQPVERGQPLASRQDAQPQVAQVVRQQNRRRFAQPERRAFAARRRGPDVHVERHDQHAGSRRRRVRPDRPGNRREHEERYRQDAYRSFRHRLMPPSPVPWRHPFRPDGPQ